MIRAVSIQPRARAVSLKPSDRVAGELSLSLKICSLLDGTYLGARLRIRDITPRSFWREDDPGWRTPARISRPLTPELKSFLDHVIVPLLVNAYVTEVGA